MGIDKSNIRWVIHYNMPKNLEGYYQEIGRAGRDGLPSDTLLFHSYSDVIQLQKFASNAKNQDVQLAKLDRMKQYSEALSCRRKILLSYFGEYLPEDCGNCDICRNPPEFFDGTIIAQKALSCIFRLKASEPISAVIDVLRGSQNEVIRRNNYQELSTYGIGKDISWNHWQQYLIQLINLGYVEIAFDRHNHLQLSEQAKKVLFEKEKVYLADIKEQQAQAQTEKTTKSTTSSLFERLRKLRLEIAREEDIPAYLIFNDATLKDMEKQRPMSDSEFMLIDGVGRKKMENYGYRFIKEIIAFSKEKREKKKPKKTKKGNTLNETLDLYKEGLTVEEIARRKGVTKNTIFTHLIKLYDEGKNINLKRYVGKSELKSVKKAKKELDNPNSLRTYYEYFEEAIPYENIKISLKVLEKEN